MRNLNDYDVIFCDIDDTLIYGFWTDLMKHTWNIFRSNALSDILMDLQYVYKFYKVNQKLRHMLVNCDTDIIFLTARKYRQTTVFLIHEILNTKLNVTICHLATDHPATDKYNKIVAFMQTCPAYQRACMFDDNKEVRNLVATLDIDVFDPTVLFEDKIG